MKALLWIAACLLTAGTARADDVPMTPATAPPGLAPQGPPIMPRHYDGTRWQLSAGLILRATNYDVRADEVRTQLAEYGLGTGKGRLGGFHAEAVYRTRPWLELGGSWTYLEADRAAEASGSRLATRMDHLGAVARFYIDGLGWSRLASPRRLAILPRVEVGAASEEDELHHEVVRRWRPYAHGGVDVEMGGLQIGLRAHTGYTYVLGGNDPWLAAAGGLDFELGGYVRW